MIVEQKTDGAQERAIVIGMIVDKSALGAIAAKWDPVQGLLDSKWANIVGAWCVRHYGKHRTAPGDSIEGYFSRWAEKQRDKAQVKIVESFLQSLSGQYQRLRKRSQTGYLIDCAGVYFTKVRAKRLKEEIEQFTETGEVEKATAAIRKFHNVEIGLGSGIDVLTDYEALRRAFEHKSDPVIRYDGAIGKFFGDSLERDGFISFEAPEKRGKTFILMDLAWQAMRQGRRVAFFEVGDLSEGQALYRFATRAARKSKDAEEYLYPISLTPPSDGERFCTAVTETRKGDSLTLDQALRAFKKLSKNKKGQLKLSTHAMSTLSVVGMGSVLEGWQRDGWVPDVIVVDYADILAPVDGRAESRDQVNATWKGLRKLSQELHCLVLTATQTDADSYDTEIIEMSNYSEDKRKRAHVTGSVGINQTDSEKEMGIYRLNWIVRREWAFSRKSCCHVAGCLALARPFIHSCFGGG